MPVPVLEVSIKVFRSNSTKRIESCLIERLMSWCSSCPLRVSKSCSTSSCEVANQPGDAIPSGAMWLTNLVSKMSPRWNSRWRLTSSSVNKEPTRTTCSCTRTVVESRSGCSATVAVSEEDSFPYHGNQCKNWRVPEGCKASSDSHHTRAALTQRSRWKATGKSSGMGKRPTCPETRVPVSQPSLGP